MSSTRPPGSLATDTGADPALSSLGPGSASSEPTATTQNPYSNSDPLLMTPGGGIWARISQSIQTTLHFCIPADSLLWQGRAGGLVWPIARGQPAVKSKSQLGPGPSATCRKIPQSYHPLLAVRHPEA